MTPDEHDTAYVEGTRRDWLTIFGACLQGLGYAGPEYRDYRWIAEREEAVAILRQVCGDFGDNEWDETLHLRDVIDKHLARHLHERERQNR